MGGAGDILGSGTENQDRKRVVLESLYRRHLEELRRYAWRYTQCRSEAEDVVHEVILRVLERLLQPRQLPALTSGYLFRALRNQGINHTRREGVARDNSSLAMHDQHLVPPSPAVDLDRRLLAADLVRAVNSLPPRYRQAFVLVVVEGLAYSEAARTMLISPNTVRELVRRARSQLRIALSNHSPDRS